MSIGARVKEAREALGITSSEVARRAGLTKSAVWQIEHDQREPTASTLRKLAAALSVTVDWLLEINDDPLVDLRREVAELREWQRRVRAAVAGRGEGEG